MRARVRVACVRWKGDKSVACEFQLTHNTYTYTHTHTCVGGGGHAGSRSCAGVRACVYLMMLQNELAELERRRSSEESLAAQSEASLGKFPSPRSR